jgi:SiaC family regulatory phosphoprotein
MNELIIEPTKYSPRVDLNPDGNICITGRSIVEDSYSFYKPVLEWAKNSTCDKLRVEIKLEYINTSSSKQIFTLLNLIHQNGSIHNVNVHWYYEEGDDDTFELGKEFESEIEIPFDFFEYSETAN